ncbi:hypothetical protein L1267_12530 [Pseudoalteromonas sp. OFAV1]|uniref:hypothetical protein n=1 Tax=Pseudoalteromonas sp. OFAV1 TaxID=2908892 RepID=UPI001F3F8565|nr:hypothetical protein [Pseudoalteromonas sp. OFAV1]MCF2901219.1 hypothetical protein [Pseudoalteromonas sp. OFAV1]
MNTKNLEVHTQRGFTILEFIFLVSIFSIAAILTMQYEQQEKSQESGRQMGVKLMSYNNGVARYVSLNSTKTSVRELDTDLDNELIFTGVDWLRSVDCPDPGLADKNYLPCDFTDGFTSINGSSFVTRIDITEPNSMFAHTHVDFRFADFGDASFDKVSESMLGLAALTAMGGDKNRKITLSNEDGVGSEINPDGTPATKIFLGYSDNKYLYCPQNLDSGLLDSFCVSSKDTVDPEGGLLVALTSNRNSNDSWVRTDGSSEMQGRFQFKADNENRDIVFVNRIYNVLGKAIIFGNSEVFDSATDDFEPVLGSGVVFDTDTYITGSLENDLNINTKGDIFSKGDISSKGELVTVRGVGTDGDLDTTANLNVTMGGLFNNGISTQRKLETNSLKANSFVESQNLYVLGSVIADRTASSKYIRSSDMLISDSDISVLDDYTSTGNVSIEGSSFNTGKTLIEGNLGSDEGNTYLSKTYADMIIDNNGNYILDPSHVSLVNTLRNNTMAPSVNGESLNLNANSIYFASEDITCNVADRDYTRCSSKVSGYVDLENLMIRSPADSRWVGFLDVLNGMDQYNADIQGEIYDAAESLTKEIPDELTGHECNGSTVLEPMKASDASDAMSLGWSCTLQDNYVDPTTGEQMYMCETSCAIPLEPVSECQSDGYLEDTVEVTGNTNNVPSDWSCSLKSNVGGVPIYTCKIACDYVEPEPENFCKADHANNVTIKYRIMAGGGVVSNSKSWSYYWDGERVGYGRGQPEAPLQTGMNMYLMKSNRWYYSEAPYGMSTHILTVTEKYETCKIGS